MNAFANFYFETYYRLPGMGPVANAETYLFNQYFYLQTDVAGVDPAKDLTDEVKIDERPEIKADNLKLENNDFPDSFMDYKSKGYSAELIGKETFDGTETFKIKLTKEPKTIDGKKEDDITFYFFDTENYVPIAIQTMITQGPSKGMTMEITMSDYQEVEGLYFPFSQTQGIKDQPSLPLIIDSIELNPIIDEKEFKFPEN